MLITLDDYRDWVEMEVTKQFLSDLAEKRLNMLESLYRGVLNGREKEALIEAGCIKNIDEVISLIHLRKGEWNEG
ncbi:MAG: hypothetical protein DDT23_01064 [candidate division WS2 bacterium]|nr:hypothetical protein [Candidatus Lithacetigena glycinireducens]